VVTIFSPSLLKCSVLNIHPPKKSKKLRRKITSSTVRIRKKIKEWLMMKWDEVRWSENWYYGCCCCAAKGCHFQWIIFRGSSVIFGGFCFVSSLLLYFIDPRNHKLNYNVFIPHSLVPDSTCLRSTSNTGNSSKHYNTTTLFQRLGKDVYLLTQQLKSIKVCTHVEGTVALLLSSIDSYSNSKLSWAHMKLKICIINYLLRKVLLLL
jgi:hypothetical protein